MMIEIMIAVPKEETEDRKTQVIFLRKSPVQKNHKVGEIISILRRESVNLGFAWCLIRRVVPSAPQAIQNSRGMKDN